MPVPQDGLPLHERLVPDAVDRVHRSIGGILRGLLLPLGHVAIKHREWHLDLHHVRDLRYRTACGTLLGLLGAGADFFFFEFFELGFPR